MNRALSLTVILATLSLGAWAESRAGGGPLDAILDPLNADLGALVASIGTDVGPQLLQATLAGDIVGEAAFKGDFPHGSFTTPGVGISLGKGIATVLNDGARDWQFISPFPTLIQSVVGSSGTGHDVYQATRQVFPYPTAGFGAGFGLARGIEILIDGIYMPRALTDALMGILPLPATVSSLGPTLSATSVAVKVRKVFLRDTGGYPAMSLALGGVYGSIKLGATIDLAVINGKPYDISGIGTLNLVGPMSFDATVFGTGLEFAISKRLPVITPFAKAGIWYRRATVASATDLVATITSTDGLTSNTRTISASPTAVTEGIDARLGAGLEIRLFALILHLAANINLEDPLVQISSLSLTGIAANGLSLSAGLRWAF